jgi:DHA2 family multidrug resistance protein
VSESAARDSDARTPPLAVWLAFSAMIFGNFMALIDIQIVASSIGVIQAGLNASRDEISWVQTAYLIAEVIGIPLSGFLGRALGTRTLFCLSALGFTFSSLLCAFAWDIGSLIVFRALQGFLGAAMIPTTTAMLYLAFPPRLQPVGGAVLGMVTMLGSTVGPTLGGLVAEALGWRALFWINLAPGLLVAAAVWRFMAGLGSSDRSLLRRIDIPGLVGLALFLGAAEYVLEEGPANDWFASSEVTLWALVSAAGAVLFFWRAFRATTPIVDLRPFQTPTFAVGALLAFVIGANLFNTLFLTPIFLGEVRGYNALQIGQTMFVQGLMMFATGPFLGTIVRRVQDTRLLGAAGFLLVAASALTQAHFTAQSSFWELFVPQALRGVGLVVVFTAIMQPTLGSLPTHLVHAGSGLFNTVRNLGGAFGIAALATLQAHAFALHRQELYSAVDPSNPHVQAMLSQMRAHLEQTGAADPERQALMNYAGMLDREALVMTFNDQFLLLAVILAISALAMLTLKPAPAARALPPELTRPH